MAVYFISVDGAIEEIESTVAEDGKSVTAVLSHFSSYALVDLDNGAAADADAVVDAGAASNTVLWVIVAIAVVLVLAGVVLAIVLVKKKKNTVK